MPGKVDSITAKSDGFHLKAQALLASGVAGEPYAPSGTDDPVPREAARIVVQRPRHLAGCTRKSRRFRYLAVSSHFAFGNPLDCLSQLSKHHLRRHGHVTMKKIPGECHSP